MNNIYDFHMHSNKSDGGSTPKDLVAFCKQRGLKAIALTDHDTVSGVAEAIEEGKRLGIKVLPGVELSTTYNGEEVHILGYGIPYQDEKFLAFLDYLKEMREERNKLIIKRLRSNGVVLDYDEIKKDAESVVVGRYQIAKVMAEKGFCRSPAEAFDRFIGVGQPCFVSVLRIPTPDAVSKLKEFGAFTSLAHPANLMRSGKLEDLLDILIPLGLDGMECYYHSHSERDRDSLKEIAIKRKLHATGGSDFHDSGHGGLPGSGYVVLEEETKKLLGLDD